MRNKRIKERASVLNTASANNGLSLVVASTKAQLPKVELCGYGCKSCNTQFASTKGLEPFCVNCGTDTVEVLATAKIAKPAEAELCALHCSSCGTNNVTTAAIASSLDGHMHCVECGTGLSYDYDDLSEPISDADSSAIEQTLQTAPESPDGVRANAISPDDRGGMTDDSPIKDADAQSIKEALPTTPVAPVEVPAAAAPVVDPAVVATTPVPAPVVDNGVGVIAEVPSQQMPEQAPEAPAVVNLEDEELLQHADWQDMGGSTACEYSNVSLAAIVLARNKDAQLSMVVSDDAIYAFADGIPVAQLAKADAGENASIFHSQSFTRAIARVAKDEGVRKALASFGFKAHRVDFPVTAAVKATATKTLESATAGLETRATNLVNEFNECLSMAAAGLNKNFFRTGSNALRRGFVDMLASAGVTNPAVMVDRVFAANGDDYNRDLLVQANELLAKSPEVRAQLAEAMDSVNPMPSEVNPDTQEVVVEHAEVLSRRMEDSAIRRTPATASATRVTAGNSGNAIQTLRQNAGGKFFN